MFEYGHKIQEEVKTKQSGKKENVPTVTERKLGLKSTVWTRRKKETFNQNRMKKQEFQKNEERLRNFLDNFKCSNI